MAVVVDLPLVPVMTSDPGAVGLLHPQAKAADDGHPAPLRVG